MERMENLKKTIKGKMLQKGIIFFIISGLLLILLFTGVAFAVFTDNSVVGSWQIDADNEESDKILTFNGDNTVSLEINSLKLDGTYEVKSANAMQIDIEVNSQSVMQGDYTYNVNSSLNKKTLELKDQGQKLTKYKQYKKEMKKPDPNIKLDEKLFGTWVDEERNSEYEFKDAGILNIKNSNLTISLKYTANNGKVSFLQNIGARAEENDLNYSIDGDKLVLGEVTLRKK